MTSESRDKLAAFISTTYNRAMCAELWKLIEGYPEYEVSTLGQVRSLPRIVIRRRPGVPPEPFPVRGGIIKGWMRRYRNGRPVVKCVSLCRDGRLDIRRVHRLVLDAFVGPCPSGMEGCHNDGNPANNCLDNLRWDTHAGNMDDSIRHGTNTKPPVHYGVAHHNVTLSFQQIQDIRVRYTGVRGEATALSKEFGVSITSILRIVTYKTRVAA